MPRSTRKRKSIPEDLPQEQIVPEDNRSQNTMDETSVYTHEVTDALSATAEAVEALAAEPTAEPTVDVPVDIETLTPEQRLAVLEQLLTAQREQRAQEKAERAARRAARDSGQSERVQRDAEMLTDIAARLLALEPTQTKSDPRGFRRYTGTVVIDGKELRITATAHEARKRGRPRKASENGSQDAEAPADVNESDDEYSADETDYSAPDYEAENV